VPDPVVSRGRAIQRVRRARPRRAARERLQSVRRDRVRRALRGISALNSQSRARVNRVGETAPRTKRSAGRSWSDAPREANERRFAREVQRPPRVGLEPLVVRSAERGPLDGLGGQAKLGAVGDLGELAPQGVVRVPVDDRGRVSAEHMGEDPLAVLRHDRVDGLAHGLSARDGLVEHRALGGIEPPCRAGARARRGRMDDLSRLSFCAPSGRSCRGAQSFKGGHALQPRGARRFVCAQRPR